MDAQSARGVGVFHWVELMGWRPIASVAALVASLAGLAARPISAPVHSAAALLACYLLTLLWQNRRLPGEPPVVWSWVPFLGSAIVFGKGPLAWLLHQSSELRSDVFVAIIAGKRMTFCTNPKHWRQILKEPSSKLEFKSIAKGVVENAFGPDKADTEAVFSVTQKTTHQQFIRFLQHSEHLGALTKAASEALSDSLANLPANAPLFATLAEPLFLATMRALHGEGQFTDATVFADFKAFDAKFAYLAGGAPLSAFPSSARALGRLVGRYLTDPKYTSGAAEVSGLMRSRHELFAPICTADGYASLQVSVLWAAAANTVPAALWTAYWLARVPPERGQRRVRAEIAARLAVEPDVAEAVKEEGAFPVLDAAISEAMRLATASLSVRCVVPADYVLPATAKAAKAKAPRKSSSLSEGQPPEVEAEAEAEAEVEGDMPTATPPWRLRRGDRVALYPPLLHLDETEVGPHPERFELDRYLVADPPPLMPFGGGISLCPGRKFAWREIKVFLILLLSRYELELDDPDAPVPPSDATRVGLGIIGPAPGADVGATFKPRA